MSNYSPKVTIIVATLNSENTLSDCLISIQSQTYLNKELIVIDGGSTDGTLKIVEENIDTINYFISEKDEGVYHAWNKGVKLALGDWICFLGSDDYYSSCTVLEEMIQKIHSVVPDRINVVYGKVEQISADGRQNIMIGEEWAIIKNQFKKIMCIPHPAVFHRRSLFLKHGEFDKSYRIAGDYEFLLRELIDNDAYSFMDITVVSMREGGMSSRRENTLLSLREMWKAQRKHHISFINRLLLLRMFKEYFAKYLISFATRPH